MGSAGVLAGEIATRRLLCASAALLNRDNRIWQKDALDFLLFSDQCRNVNAKRTRSRPLRSQILYGSIDHGLLKFCHMMF